MNAKTQIDSKTKTLLFALPGDLTSSNVAIYKGEFAELLKDNESTPRSWDVFRLDVAGAAMIDSMGLNFVVGIFRQIDRLGVKMQVAYRDSNVYRTLLFTRLDKHVELVKI